MAKKNNAAKKVRPFIATVETDSILTRISRKSESHTMKLTRLTPTTFKSFMVARCFLSPRSYNLSIFCYIFKMFILFRFSFLIKLKRSTEKVVLLPRFQIWYEVAIAWKRNQQFYSDRYSLSFCLVWLMVTTVDNESSLWLQTTPTELREL